MISQRTQLETKVNEKTHMYQCDPLASLQDVLQALNTFRSYIVGRIKESEDQQKPSEDAPKPE